MFLCTVIVKLIHVHVVYITSMSQTSVLLEQVKFSVGLLQPLFHFSLCLWCSLSYCSDIPATQTQTHVYKSYKYIQHLLNEALGERKSTWRLWYPCNINTDLTGIYNTCTWQFKHKLGETPGECESPLRPDCDPDCHQNLITYSFYLSGPLHTISSQFVHNFLSNVGKNIVLVKINLSAE